MKKSIKSDVIISYVSLILSLVVMLILTKVEVKYLGKDLYGVFTLINSTIGYIAILDMGVGQTIIRYISQFRAEGKKSQIDKLAGHSFKTYIKIACIGLIIGIFIIYYAQEIFNSLNTNNISIFRICFFISLLNILLQIPAATFNAVLSAYNEFKIIRLLNIFRSCFRAIFITLLLKLNFGMIAIVLVDLVVTQIINVYCFLYMNLKLEVKMNFSPISKSLKKELFSYSFFIFLGIITDQIFWKTDSIILGVMGTSSIVAVYGISSQLISQFLNICSTFSSVFLPRIVEKITNGCTQKEINKFFIKASRYQFMFVAIIIVSYIFIGKDFIILWLGGGYSDAYRYGLIIILSLVVPMFQTTGYQILFAINKHKFRSIIYLINAIMNIVLSIVLFKLIGADGVAFATAIAMIIGNTLIMNIYYKHTFKIKLFYFFKEVCGKVSLVAIVTSFIYYLMNSFVGVSLIGFIIKGSIGCLCYIILIFIVVLNRKEKQEILKIKSKILG